MRTLQLYLHYLKGEHTKGPGISAGGDDLKVGALDVALGGCLRWQDGCSQSTASVEVVTPCHMISFSVTSLFCLTVPLF
jgi:hypothetical protein